jgi:hypothetical protein
MDRAVQKLKHSNRHTGGGWHSITVLHAAPHTVEMINNPGATVSACVFVLVATS